MKNPARASWPNTKSLCHPINKKNMERRMKLLKWSLFGFFVFCFLYLLCMGENAHKVNMEGADMPLKFTILYDNYLHEQGTKPDWGFACLIEGTEKVILFDAGTQPDILFHNVDHLGVDLTKVERIVISHDHHDHIGGLEKVLEKKHDVAVYLPISFSDEIVQSVEAKKARVVSVNDPVEICRDVYSTGEMGVQIKEQSLVINTKKGLIIVTGCSHQGIVDILKRAKELYDRPIYLVFGGFHLLAMPDARVEAIIQDFKQIGVEKCGATHCTGDRPIALFKKAFGDNYVAMGTGRILEIKQ
jgi:7,8-dihydropterin-6-yl-methyl-4-(beta-D-ribofuranosyl)aminobenzene 5'-phosphate synthase